MNSLTLRAEPANLPALRTSSALAVRTTPVVPPSQPRSGRMLLAALVVTLFAFPLAGLVLSLIGAGQ